jgi:predicted nuclease of predicted toxin-antitoxin system
LTKDRDFVLLVERFGPPPQVVWITCGNTSNERLRKVLAASFPQALELLRRGEPVVEISDSFS